MNATPPRIGENSPGFDLPSTRPFAEHPGRFRLADARGRWVMVVFYPRDFTFVCPTELTAISARIGEFWERRCEVVGISVDTLETHEEWIETPPADGGVGPLRFPLASDPGGEVARRFGVYDDAAQVALRGLFIVDPSGRLQYQVVHGLSVGRSAEEPLRVLDALRQGGLCPYGWTLGDGTLDPMQMLKKGIVLGHYRIFEKLGEGAFSQVFRAEDIWLQREVAIKVLRPGSQVDVDFVLHEARAAAALNHPNVCTIYTVEEQEGLPVIVMESLSGETLDERLARGALSHGDTRELGRTVARAMDASHRANVVHGDLKPGNIMLTAGGPKILDFGIATRDGLQVIPSSPPAIEADPGPGATVSSSDLVVQFAELAEMSDGPPSAVRAVDGPLPDSRPVFCGTPEYAAPERIYGGVATPASDVFSLGVTLYQMITGQQAFAGSNPLEMMVERHGADVGELVRRLPDRFRVPVGRALRVDPGQRSSMAELAELL